MDSRDCNSRSKNKIKIFVHHVDLILKNPDYFIISSKWSNEAFGGKSLRGWNQILCSFSVFFWINTISSANIFYNNILSVLKYLTISPFQSDISLLIEFSIKCTKTFYIIVHHRLQSFWTELGSNPLKFLQHFVLRESEWNARTRTNSISSRKKKKKRKFRVAHLFAFLYICSIISRPGEQSLGSSFSHLIE